MIYTTKSEPGKEPSEWKVSKLVDVGTNELFQARFRELSEILKSTHTWDNDKKTSITDAFWHLVLDGFTPAFLHLRTATALSADAESPLLNTRTEYDSFYSKLWTAYQHRLLDLAKEMGYKLNFLLADGDDKFLEQGKLFIQQHGLAPEILAFLAEQRVSWQNKLAIIRNKVVLHPTIKHQTVPEIYTPAVASLYFCHCWQTAEFIVAILLSKHLPPWCILTELPPELTENGRRIFQLQIDPVKFGIKVES